MKRTNDSIAREYIARVVLDHFGHVPIDRSLDINIVKNNTIESLTELRDKKTKYINCVVEAMNDLEEDLYGEE